LFLWRSEEMLAMEKEIERMEGVAEGEPIGGEARRPLEELPVAARDLLSRNHNKTSDQSETHQARSQDDADPESRRGRLLEPEQEAQEGLKGAYKGGDFGRSKEGLGKAGQEGPSAVRVTGSYKTYYSADDYGTRDFYNRNQYDVTGGDLEPNERLKKHSGDRTRGLSGTGAFGDRMAGAPRVAPETVTMAKKDHGPAAVAGGFPSKPGKRDVRSRLEGVWRPRCDMIELQDFVKVLVELPGVEKEDIRLLLHNGSILRVTAKKRLLPPDFESQQEGGEPGKLNDQEEQLLIRNEIHYGTYFRALDIPVPLDVNPAGEGGSGDERLVVEGDDDDAAAVTLKEMRFRAADIHARFEDGILCVELPKANLRQKIEARAPLLDVGRRIPIPASALPAGAASR
jgi:HSP20 family molecular chaperone IbpA